MAWEEKLLTAIDDSKDMPKLKIVFRFSRPVDDGFVKKLQRKFPFLEDEYLRFFSITDGASLWMYEFFGSGSSEMPALDDLMKRWQPNVESLRVFPFAENPSGDCIAMRENGEVCNAPQKLDHFWAFVMEVLVVRSSFEIVVAGPLSC